MRFKLRTILSITHGVTTLATVGLIVLLTSSVIDNRFVTFVVDNNQERINSIIRDISHQYSEGWSTLKLEETSKRALDNGLIIKVTDQNGNTQFDEAEMFPLETKSALESIEMNMKMHDKNWTGEIVVKTFHLAHDHNDLGELYVSYYSPYYFTEMESELIKSVHEVLNVARFLALIIAIIVGIIISRQISIPISRAIKVTHGIAKGNLNERIIINTKMNEINDLSESVNLLATSLQGHEIARKRIVADVSHELRTPLAALQISMEALVDGVIEPTPLRLEGIYKEVLRLNRLVGDLTQLTKYEVKSEKLNIMRFNLVETINTIAVSFETKCQNRELVLKIDCAVKEFTGDKDKMSQVIVNLLSNSIKYCKREGTILIKSYEQNNEIIISVLDEGIGIPEEDLPFIFERFYRVDKSRDKETGGSGIGLTIVKEIVEAHCGTISIKSIKGEGTEAIIKFKKTSIK